MKQIKKIIHSQDAGLKQSARKSGETSINLSNEILEFLCSSTIERGDERNITFTLYKDDILKALIFIFNNLPLYISSSDSFKKVDFYSYNFEKYYDQLEEFFGKNPTQEYTVNLYYRPDGRIYLNNLKVGKFSLRNFLIEDKTALFFLKDDSDKFTIRLITGDYKDDTKLHDEESSEFVNYKPSQIIYYGAPGTGKSYAINKQIGGEENPNAIRTTFHPDSDYSSFVGCYKPIQNGNERKISIISADDLIEQAKTITKVVDQVNFLCDNAESIIPAGEAKGITTNKLIWDLFGWHNETYFVSILTKILKERANTSDTEITYKFCPQSFTKAYVNAWSNPNNQYFLVIEEINRGNCAQIFGDIFQLLDRNNETGESCFSISPDNDLQKYLYESFNNIDIEDAEIKLGKKMRLPSNLSIYATMNTSDQSLFPIDSAFKRRWEWKYIPIKKDEDNHFIECGNERYDWWDFLEKVNQKIDKTTDSEDKQLGFWFVKPEDENGRISAEKFVSKVVFYLWNDIFKDYTNDSNNAFRTDNGLLKFRYFFDGSGNIIINILEQFLKGLNVLTINSESEEMDEDGNTSNNEIKDYSKYSINGQGTYSKGMAVFEAVKLFIDKNPNMSNEDIVKAWLDLGINVPNLIETKTIHDNRIQTSSDARISEKSKEIKLNDTDSIFISNQFNVKRIDDFIEKVNSTNWDIIIKKV